MTGTKKPISPKKQASKLASDIGRLYLAELRTGKELEGYTKHIPLNISEHTYHANIAILKRQYQKLHAARLKAVQDLKALLNVNF